jgi:hypothetical protein
MCTSRHVSFSSTLVTVLGFQAQLFSDKGLDEHFGSVPFVFPGRKLESEPMRGAPETPL